MQLILVRRETSPEDLRGMKVAQGILTAFGGASSHAALVSRQMGKACIVGCGDLNIDYDAGTVTVGGKVLKEGDSISIDGFTGEVFEGAVANPAQRNPAGADRQDAQARARPRPTSATSS